jgi:hypothetical protein
MAFIIYLVLGGGSESQPECVPLCECCSAFVTDHNHCNAASKKKPVLHWTTDQRIRIILESVSNSSVYIIVNP